MQIYIKVFLTKKHKIRVRISKIHKMDERKTNTVEEVTVGGKKWNSGNYGEYIPEIRKRVEKLACYLNSQLNAHL